MYTNELAKELKKSAGKKWRPANGTEGMMFEEMYCQKCKKFDDNLFEIIMKTLGEAFELGEDGCFIYDLTMLKDIDDPEYPQEWQIGEDGQPTCTAFEKGNGIL